MNIDIRPIAEQQLPLVVQIQAEAYAAHLQEDEESFFAKYKMYPNGFIGAFVDNTLAGYSISFPWYQDIPVTLNLSSQRTDQDFDCYYMHDVAVSAKYRSLGIADKLVNRCLDTARSLNLHTIRMVTVQGGEKIWSRYGFTVYGTADESYGPNAYKMTITLTH